MSADASADAGDGDPPEVWEDLTDFFRETASKMVTGQMIHGERFNLREAMSALELMDPKMDAGMNTEPIMTLAVALEEGKVARDLDVPQMLAVIDELVACEVGWHQGDSVVHTLYTCLYLHDPSVLSSPILRAYINCLLKTCDVVRAVILDANIYEEEDFAANKFTFDLGESLVHDEVLHELQAIEKDLELKLRQANGKVVSEPVPALQDDPDKEKAYCEALLCRVRFRKAFFLLNMKLAEVKTAMQGLKAAEKYAKTVSRELKLIRGTLSLANPAPEEEKSMTFSTAGFDKSVVRTIANAPPKEIKIISRSACLDFFEGFVSSVNKFFPIFEIDNLGEMLVYFKCFSALESPILIRSHLLRLLHSTDDFAGKGPLPGLLEKIHHKFCGSTVGCTNTEDFTIHVTRAARPVYMIFRLFCENHTRQRRRICKMLPDWTILQQDANHLDHQCIMKWEAEGVDLNNAQTAPYKYAFFSWIFDVTTQLLGDYFLLSFELELFTNRELAIAYWYLEYLLEVRLRNYDIAWRPLPVPDNSAKTSKTKKGRKERKKKAPKPKPRGPPPKTWDFVLVEAMLNMCKGIGMTLAVLKRAGAKVPALNQENEEIWFANRFAVDMSKVPQPRVLQLAQYRQVEDYYSKLDFAELCKYGLTIFDNVKVLAGRALAHTNGPPEHVQAAIKGLQRVAVTNAVTLMAASKKKLDGKRVEFDFKQHRSFPVIKIV